jgi:hypothetical protein
LYKFEILNTKNHLKFVKNFFNYKNTQISSWKKVQLHVTWKDEF